MSRASKRLAGVTLAMTAATLVGGVLAGGTGHAQAQGKQSALTQAEALNAEGKTLIKQLDLAGAAQRFRAAMALSDDPRFAFNLCYTLEKSGQLPEAKAACEKVMASGDARLSHKANKLLAVIEESMSGNGTSTTPPVAAPVPVAVAPATTPPPPPPAPPVQSTPAKPAARIRYGVVGGLSRANVTSSGFDESDAVLGYAVGGWVRMPLRRSFNTIFETQLVQRGFAVESVDLVDAELSSTYLDLSFASRWHLASGAARPYLEAGTTLSLLLSATATVAGDELDADQQSLDVAYALGVGTQIDVGDLGIDIRVRYLHGLLSINKEDSGPVGDRSQAYNRSVLTQVGMWF